MGCFGEDARAADEVRHGDVVIAVEGELAAVEDRTSAECACGAAVADTHFARLKCERAAECIGAGIGEDENARTRFQQAAGA